MTSLPLPPPLPDEGHDERHPDTLTTWDRGALHFASMWAVTPAETLVRGNARSITRDVHERMDIVKRTPLTMLRPRTKPTIVNGYERAEPAGPFWCAVAGLAPDEGAGARLIQSEVGTLLARGYVQYAIAVGLATMNEAHRRATSFEPGAVFRLVTSDRRSQHAGYFGRQGGRWAASLQDPTVRALEAWRLASRMHGDGQDFTLGARRWDDGWTQDRLWKARRVNHDALGIVRKWAAEGWEWAGPIYESDGATVLIDPYRLCLFRFVGRKADVWRGEQAIKDGRARWGVRA